VDRLLRGTVYDAPLGVATCRASCKGKFRCELSGMQPDGADVVELEELRLRHGEAAVDPGIDADCHEDAHGEQQKKEHSARSTNQPSCQEQRLRPDERRCCVSLVLMHDRCRCRGPIERPRVKRGKVLSREDTTLRLQGGSRSLGLRFLLLLVRVLRASHDVSKGQSALRIHIQRRLPSIAADVGGEASAAGHGCGTVGLAQERAAERHDLLL